MDTQAITDIASLDDPEFLAARARVRLAYELTPSDPDLAAQHSRLTAEFERRASAAWQQASAS
jgi:hypothetical protein